MQLPIHWILGTIVKRHLESKIDLKLDSNGFLYGNIRPDLNADYIHTSDNAPPKKVSHMTSDSLEYLFERVDRLIHSISTSEMSLKAFSIELGHINHYFSDFFCFAHSEAFPDDIIKHYIYESKQSLYMLANLDYFSNRLRLPVINTLKYDNVRDLFELFHKDYRTTSVSYKNDLSSAISFNIALNVFITDFVIEKDINLLIA